jgi:lipopolysaccharide/colanic/teichoic acid biosynthesis glycosyltransferase
VRAKRFLDLVLACIGLVLLTVPMLLIAIWVRLDSRGPVFFRQQRVGLEGRPFHIIKFRSMRTDAGGLGITVGVDPRITHAGRILRRYKLDELPQLFNVLAGHMSFVGPRPELPRYVELYPPEVRRTVLSVRPGVTDPASIAFANESELLGRAADPEAMYRDVILPEKLRLYCEYVRSRSLLRDFGLMFRTVLVALRN